MKVLGFTGHRPHKLPWGNNEEDERCLELKCLMEKEITRLVREENVTYMLSGMAQGIDIYAAEIAIKLREQNPDIFLECVLPHEEQAARWSLFWRNRYFSVMERCDKEYLLQDIYTADCYAKRNAYIANRCDILLAVTSGARSGAEQTVKMAQSLDKTILVINPLTMEIKRCN